MNWLLPRLSGILELILCAGLVGWILWLWLKKSEDPARLISKWVISVVMLSVTWWIAGRRIAGSSGGMDYSTDTAPGHNTNCDVSG